jgi:tetratricopeptide (TPR) repeat protein
MNEERLEAYVNLMQVLRQATAASKGNPQVMYPLLRENLDKLDDNFARVLQEWTMATLPKVEAGQAISIAADIANLSNLMGQFPLGSKASNMEIAITGYEVALTVFTRNNYSETWALIQSNLGAAYRNRIQGEQADNIEKAITCYQEALQVLTPEDFPQQWAMTQNNLGLAYTNRIREQRAANLEDAIICYQKALQVLIPKAFPQPWAMTQNNPLPSVWGITFIFRWLYPRKLVNLSESDGRAIIWDLPTVIESGRKGLLT